MQPIKKPFAAPKTKPKTLFSPLIAELLVVALSNNFESNKIASLIKIQTAIIETIIVQVLPICSGV